MVNLKEYQGKKLFKKYKIPLSRSILVKNLKFKLFKANEYVLKAQVPSGKRKKAGLIIFSKKKDIKINLKKLFDKGVKEILIEEKLKVSKQIYLGLTINRANKNIMLIVGEKGGIDIEEMAKKYPEKMYYCEINEEISCDLSRFKEYLINIIEPMYKIMKDYDALLVEINPLVVSNGSLVALDSKIVIDDNALFRQKFKEENLTKIEKKARSLGIHYVELDGDIGVIGNGAGMVMSTLDLIDWYGGKAANFLDVGASADVEVMVKSLKVLLLQKPKKIFINIFGGMVKCDEMAEGIIDLLNKIKVPLVVRIVGHNEEKARKMLNKNGIIAVKSMEQGVKLVVG